MGVRRKPHRGQVCLRVARRFGQLVAFIRKRKLGVPRGWSDAAPLRVYQRHADPGVGTQVSLAAGPPSGRPSWAERVGPLIGGEFGDAATARSRCLQATQGLMTVN